MSRELFEAWCEDEKNCVVIADFAVQGTLAREILGNPAEVMSRNGIKVCSASCWWALSGAEAGLVEDEGSELGLGNRGSKLV